MLTVYSWDEVSGEVTKVEIDLDADAAMPEDIYQAVLRAFGEEPDPVSGLVEDDPEYGFHSRTDLGSLTLMTGRFGRDKQFMMWWGTGSAPENLAHVVGTAFEEGN